VDVAVDLSALAPVGRWGGGAGPSACPRLELAVESPTGRHVGSASVIECSKSALDLVIHLRGDPEPGEHTLHVGLFWGETMLQHERRTFSLPLAARRTAPG
jgi:hypothetical protein